MSLKTHGKRTVTVPADIKAHVNNLLGSMPERDVAKRLGIGPNAVCRIAIGIDVMPGTLALVREAMREGRAA